MQDAHSRMLIPRMIRAARLDVSLYEEVEADRTATIQAMVVVLITSVALGIGSYSSVGAIGVAGYVLFGLVGWAVWAYAVYFIGTRLIREPQTEASWGQLARTMGFATTPLLLTILAIIPITIVVIVVVSAAYIWRLVAVIIAVRQALDYNSTLKAVAVTMLGFLAHLLVLNLLLVFL